MPSPFRRVVKDQILFSAKSATGTSTLVLDVADFRDVVLSFATSGSANMTAKIQGALAVVDSKGSYIAPSFSSAASISNAWDYIQSVDLENGDPIDGDTGIVYAGTDAVALVEVNTNALDYITVTITAYVAGALTVKAASATNL